MSGVVGAYNEEKGDFKTWGSHDTAPEGIPERVFSRPTEVRH